MVQSQRSQSENAYMSSTTWHCVKGKTIRMSCHQGFESEWERERIDKT